MNEALLKEFEREAKTTRKHFERLPEERLTWRPHPKSYTTIALASHIVDCIRWTDSIFNSHEFDVNPATFKGFQATSTEHLLNTFDEEVVKCQQGLPNANLNETWALKLKGRLMFEKLKSEVLRDFTLSHMIHHRGQLSVYLRLLEVPVPGSYGPSADELGPK